MKKNSIAESIFFVSQCIGIGSFFIANTAVESMSTSAWIAVLIGGVVCAIPVFIINFTSKKSFEQAQKNTFLKILCSLFFFLLTSFLCAHFSSVINMWILPDLSKTAISAGFCLVLFFSLFKNRISVFYTVVMISVFCILTLLISRSLIVFGGENIKLFPLFEKERMGTNIIFPVFTVFGIFSSSALLTFGFQSESRVLSWLTGLAGAIVIFILVIESCIVLIGAEQVAQFFDAMVIAMKKSDFLGRGDILFFIVWMFFIVSSFVSAGTAIKNVITIKTNKGFFYYFVYCLLVLFASGIAGNIKNLTEVFVFILGIGGGGIIILSALLCALKRKGKTNEA